MPSAEAGPPKASRLASAFLCPLSTANSHLQQMGRSEPLEGPLRSRADTKRSATPKLCQHSGREGVPCHRVLVVPSCLGAIPVPGVRVLTHIRCKVTG